MEGTGTESVEVIRLSSVTRRIHHLYIVVLVVLKLNMIEYAAEFSILAPYSCLYP